MEKTYHGLRFSTLFKEVADLEMRKFISTLLYCLNYGKIYTIVQAVLMFVEHTKVNGKGVLNENNRLYKKDEYQT